MHDDPGCGPRGAVTCDGVAECKNHDLYIQPTPPPPPSLAPQKNHHRHPHTSKTAATARDSQFCSGPRILYNFTGYNMHGTNGCDLEARGLRVVVRAVARNDCMPATQSH